jgi:rhodanese-related sulfurtransferase
MEASDIIIGGALLGIIVFVTVQKIMGNKFKVPQQDFKAKLAAENKPQLVDVRTPSEHKVNKIGNALNINIGAPDFDSKVSKLDKSKPVFVYCASGMRSGKAARKLAKLGFQKIYDLQGGINAWSA